MTHIKPKIIFFDIDDTLFCHRSQTIAPSTRQALLALREQNIKVAIATGRSPSVLPEAILKLIQEIEIDPVISINGQYSTYQGKEWISYPMAQADCQHLATQLHQLNIAYALVYPNEIIVSHETPSLQQAMSDLHIPYTPSTQHLTPLPKQTIYQMLAFYPQEQDDTVQQHLPAHLKSIRWHTHGVDLLDKQGSKARCIRAALEQLNISPEESMAFGDGLNDREMFQTVGFGVAMGNAKPELKALAKHVCPSIHADGIWHALHDLNIINCTR